MKFTALIAAAAVSLGTAAIAAQPYADQTARGEENARVDQQDHGSANEKMRNGAHRLGEKTRSAMHRLGDKMHARKDHARDGEHHARRDRMHGDRYHAERDRMDDTRAMGAAGDDNGRRSRMDEAYANWKAREGKAEHAQR